MYSVNKLCIIVYDSDNDPISILSLLVDGVCQLLKRQWKDYKVFITLIDISELYVHIAYLLPLYTRVKKQINDRFKQISEKINNNIINSLD